MPSRPTWFDSVADRLGHAPPVIETEDVRRDPRGALAALCAAIDLDFTDAMLSWPQGQHPDDGAWAPHWYGAIFATTGFAPPEEKAPDLPGHLQAIADEARPFYERMAAHRGDACARRKIPAEAKLGRCERQGARPSGSSQSLSASSVRATPPQSTDLSPSFQPMGYLFEYQTVTP